MSRSHHGRLLENWLKIGLLGGITAVFLGYLSVWIPGPAAGLQFIGVEVAEWLKFLGVGPIRNVFYLPPITLGAILVLFSTGWSNRRWQSWVWRMIGLLISLLSFPALEDITGAAQAEYFPRIWLIGFVFLLAALVTGFGFFQPRPFLIRFSLLLIAILGIVGAIYPTWLYNQVRPTIGLVIGESIGVGFGVWLNGIGHGALTAVALYMQINDKNEIVS